MGRLRLWIIPALAVALLVSPSLFRARQATAQTPGWQVLPSMATPRAFEAAALGKDGRIYVFGGAGANFNIGSDEVYDPRTRTWTPLPPMPLPLSYISAALGPDNKIYIVGGWTGQGPADAVQAFDPATNTWNCSFSGPGCASTSIAPLPSARAAVATVAGPDQLIWAIGGFDSAPVKTVEAYDPSTNRWYSGPSLLIASSGVSAIPLGTNEILTFGGTDGVQSTPPELIAPPSSSAASARIRRPAIRPRSGVDLGALITFLMAGPCFTLHFYYQTIDEDQDDNCGLGTGDVTTHPPYDGGDDDDPKKWPVLNGLYFNEAANQAFMQPYYDEMKSALDTFIGEFSPNPPGKRSRSVRARAAATGTSPQLPDRIPIRIIFGGGGDGETTASATTRAFDFLAGQTITLPSMPAPLQGAASVVTPDGTMYVIGGAGGNPANVGAGLFALSPPSLPPPPTTTPTPTLTPTVAAPVTSTPTPTPTPTNTPSPTLTSTLVHVLTARLAVRLKAVKAGQKQTLTVTTDPGASVSIGVTFPNKRTLKHSGTVDASGSLVWKFKEPRNVDRPGSHTVTVRALVSDSNGHSLTVSARYNG